MSSRPRHDSRTLEEEDSNDDSDDDDVQVTIGEIKAGPPMYGYVHILVGLMQIYSTNICSTH